MAKGRRYSQVFVDLPLVSKLLLLFIIVESLILVGLTIERMVFPKTVNSEYYSVLVLVNSILLALFAIDGVLNENVFELFAFVFISVSTMFFITYQFFSVSGQKTTEASILLIRFIAVCIFTPANALMSYLAYRNFGWRMYRKIGADPLLLGMYTLYQQMLALLKLDLQFGINLVLIAGFFLFENYELIGDIAAMILTLCWAALGWAAIRNEHRKGVIVFFVFSILQPLYICFKFIRYQVDPPRTHLFIPLIYIMGSLAILCRIVLVLFAGVCRRNFGKGLVNVFKKEDDEEKPLLTTLTKNIIQ